MIIEGKKNKYEITIGLEVHAQVSTKRKLFSNAENNFSAASNVNVNFFDLAMPGTMPILNEEVVEKVIKAGLSIQGDINLHSRFDRKHYFYPDLPSGYQITQFYKPIVSNGYVLINVEGKEKKISIDRIHIEQDAGKLIHENNSSLVDYNRAGVPLMEIVTNPDLSSPAEARAYLKKLQLLLRAVDASNADMEKGSFRCDANISVKPLGSEGYGTRCEVKNLNSIKFIAKAIEYEAKRQVTLIEQGKLVDQETRLFNPEVGETFIMRSKDDALDYHYYPDTNLLPINIKQDYIDVLLQNLPELPDVKKARYMKEFNISSDDADILVLDKNMSLLFEKLVKKHQPKLVVTWLLVELLGRLKKLNIDLNNVNIDYVKLSELFFAIESGEISGRIAKEILDIMLETNKTASEIIKEKGFKQVNDESLLLSIVSNVLTENPKEVAAYKAGKERLMGFFVGKIMKETKGSANPSIVTKFIKDKLK